VEVKMRELKFMAWDTKEKEWVDPAHGMDFVEPDSQSDAFWLDPPKRIILIQYTGLKDKHVKEIYEDFVLRVVYANIGVTGYYKVQWDPRKARFNLIDKNGDWWGFTSDMEIIGNVYENPELVKEWREGNGSTR
jgi:hypothetical protein